MSSIREVFAGEVLLETPLAPYPIVEAHIVASARELCQKARLLVETLPPLRAQVGVSNYPVEPVDCRVEPFIILDVKFQGQSLPAIKPDVGFAFQSRNVTPWLQSIRGFSAPTPKEILVLPAPTQDIDAAIVIMAQMMPRRGAAEFPDILDEFAETIAFGAKAKLLRMRNQPWFNLDGAMDARKWFLQGISAVARSRGAYGAVEPNAPVMFPRFM